MTNPDTLPASEQPWNVLRRGTFFLDGLPALQKPAYWVVRLPDGHAASAYPPGIVLLALPFYLPAALSRTPPDAAVLGAFERATAAVLCAIAALLLGFALRALGATFRQVAMGTFLAALCTPMLSLSSGALWQHTALSVTLSAILLAVARKERPASAHLVLWATAFTVLSRAPGLLLLLPFAWVARDQRRLLTAFAGGLAVGAAAMFAANAATFGSPFRSGYAYLLRGSGFTLGELPESIAGLLVSPAHGLIFFSPWVLFGLQRATSPVARACQIAALLEYGLMMLWWCWWGSAFGSRMLAEASLLLAVPVALAPPASRWGRRALAVTAAVALATHATFPALLAHDPPYSPYGAWTAEANPWVWLTRRGRRLPRDT
jgi:hypothetical protein